MADKADKRTMQDLKLATGEQGEGVQPSIISMELGTATRAQCRWLSADAGY